MYWHRWFEARPELLKSGKSIGMYSVFGPREILEKTACDVNVFYSAENLKAASYRNYSDFFLSDPRIGLSMGFEFFDDPRYVRFPNWMDVFFLTKEDVKSVCGKLRFPDVANKNRFAALISSHDRSGLRSEIADAMSAWGDVSCPGKFRHNDDSLVDEFGDDKLKYLENFYFNICPENTNAMGYCTEKVFQAISSGCIPVYWGSCNLPEPDVLNRDALILWNPGEDNASSLKLIGELMSSPRLMKEFLSQPRLLPSAEEYVMHQMDLVESRIRKLLEV